MILLNTVSAMAHHTPACTLTATRPPNTARRPRYGARPSLEHGRQICGEFGRRRRKHDRPPAGLRGPCKVARAVLAGRGLFGELDLSEIFSAECAEFGDRQRLDARRLPFDVLGRAQPF